jgi:hypothetical protein
MSGFLLGRLDRADDKVSLLLTLDECEQILVHLVLQRRAHAVRCALVTFSSAFLINFEDSIAEAPIGTIWSSSP